MDYPKIHTMEQGTPDWYEAKRGKVSASKFKTAIGKPGATRTKLMYTLIWRTWVPGRRYN